MWFATPISAILLLSTHLVPAILAENSVAGSQTAIAANSDDFSSSIELESKESAKRSDVDSRGSAVGELEARDVHAGVPKNVPISIDQAFTLSSQCQDAADNLKVQVKATWNGVKVHFAGKKNIDYFAKTRIARNSKDKSIVSHANFQHSACRAITPDKLCFYTYTGTIRATFWPYSEHQNADLTIYPADAKRPEWRLQITSGCVRSLGDDGVTRTCANWSETSDTGLSSDGSGLSMNGCESPRVLNAPI